MLRRGIYRARSYCTIGLVICIALAGQLGWRGVAGLWRGGWHWFHATNLAGAFACLWLAGVLAVKVRQLTDAAKK